MRFGYIQEPRANTGAAFFVCARTKHGVMFFICQNGECFRQNGDAQDRMVQFTPKWEMVDGINGFAETHSFLAFEVSMHRKGGEARSRCTNCPSDGNHVCDMALNPRAGPINITILANVDRARRCHTKSIIV